MLARSLANGLVLVYTLHYLVLAMRLVLIVDALALDCSQPQQLALPVIRRVRNVTRRRGRVDAKFRIRLPIAVQVGRFY